MKLQWQMLQFVTKASFRLAGVYSNILCTGDMSVTSVRVDLYIF